MKTKKIKVLKDILAILYDYESTITKIKDGKVTSFSTYTS